MNTFARVAAFFMSLIALLAAIGFWLIAGAALLSPFIKDFPIQFVYEEGNLFGLAVITMTVLSIIAGITLLFVTDQWFQHVITSPSTNSVPTPTNAVDDKEPCSPAT